MIQIIKNIGRYQNKLPKGCVYVDNYDLYIRDLFELKYPEYYKSKKADNLYAKFRIDYIKKNCGNWIYIKEKNTAYLLPNEKDYFSILTSRNKPFISEKEQSLYYNFNIGIVGLSVGQSAAISIARTGGCKNLKIADLDTVDPSNLNRIYTGIESVGIKKTISVKNKILEINPYQNIITYSDGLTKENINDFFTKDFKLNMIIDACDDFPIKLSIRHIASKLKIPVLMTTDLGDGVLIDIERYDKKNVVPFGGRHLSITKKDNFLAAAIKIISPDFFSLALANAIEKIGKDYPTHPQLGSTVTTSGSIAAYIVRKIASHTQITEDRILIDLDNYLNPYIKSKQYQDEKKLIIKKMKAIIGEK